MSLRKEDQWVSEEIIFAVPQGCVDKLGLFSPLRGKLAFFDRQAGNQTPKVEFPERKIVQELPPELDVQACLRRIWGLDHKKQDQVQADQNILKFRKLA